MPACQQPGTRPRDAVRPFIRNMYRRSCQCEKWAEIQESRICCAARVFVVTHCSCNSSRIRKTLDRTRKQCNVDALQLQIDEFGLILFKFLRRKLSTRRRFMPFDNSRSSVGHSIHGDGKMFAAFSELEPNLPVFVHPARPPCGVRSGKVELAAAVLVGPRFPAPVIGAAGKNFQPGHQPVLAARSVNVIGQICIGSHNALALVLRLEPHAGSPKHGQKEYHSSSVHS